MERTVQFHVLVAGTVQAVSYRAMTRKEALRLKLKGWVRNLDDGRVEAVFHGPEHAVQAMVNWCRRGPLQAEVSACHAQRMPLEAFLDFAVRADGAEPVIAEPVIAEPVIAEPVIAEPVIAEPVIAETEA